MTIDLYDDVLVPLIVGFAIIMSLMVVGFLIYLIVYESVVSAIIILTILFAWLIGFPIWRRQKYG